MQTEKLAVPDGPGTPARSAGEDRERSFHFRSGRARDRMDAYKDSATAGYGDIPGDARGSDPSRTPDPDATVPSDWPCAGGVRFEGVRLRYERYGAAAGGAGGPGGAAWSSGVGAGAQAAVRDAPTGAAEPPWALAGLDLELRPGERLGLVGRTGAPRHWSHQQMMYVVYTVVR